MRADYVQVRRLFRVINGGTPTAEPRNWGGDVRWFTPEDLGSATGRLVTASRRTLTADGQRAAAPIVPEGSLLLSTRAPIGHVGILGVSASFNQGCRALVPRVDMDSRYFYWHLVASRGALNAAGQGSTFAELSGAALAEFKVRAPTPDEQGRIADFLDGETARIDALIGARKRQSDLLAERAAVAASALCLRGGENVGYRSSGIGPVGDIPKQWRTLRNKVFLREVADLSTDGAEELLTVSHLTGVTTRAEKTEVTMFKAESTVGYKRCAPGDLIINTMWAWMGALGIARQHGIVSPAYGVYRFDREIADPSYFEHVFRSSAYVAEMTRYSKGVWSSRLRLYPEAFLGLSGPVPPLREQRWIVETIRRQTKGDADLREALRQSIDLLRERRRALITAAVTGRLQVPSPTTENAVA